MGKKERGIRGLAGLVSSGLLEASDVVLELREQPDCHDEEIRNLIPLNTDNFEIVQPCK